MSESEIFGRDLRTGKPVPLGKPEWVVTSSLSSPWRNLFKVERHLRPAFEREEVATPASICFFGDAIQEQVLMEWRIPGSPLRGKLLQSGDVNVASEGMPVWANHLGRTDMTGVSFSPDFLATAARESIPSEHVELKPLFAIEDQQIRTLVSLLERRRKRAVRPAACTVSPLVWPWRPMCFGNILSFQRKLSRTGAASRNIGCGKLLTTSSRTLGKIIAFRNSPMWPE